MTDDKKKNIKENIKTFAIFGISATILLTLMILLSGAPAYDSYELKKLRTQQAKTIKQYNEKSMTDSARILLRTEIESRNTEIKKIKKDSLAHAEFCNLPLQKQFNIAFNKSKQKAIQIKNNILHKIK